MKALLNCTINGEEHSVLADTRDTLLDLLRDRLGLTGTKEGCGNGNCGTCTVLMDGAPINACLVLAVEVPGRSVTTIEGLSAGGDVASAAAGAGGAWRHAMRLLHAGHRARRQGAARREPAPERGADPPRDRRQPVPLHGLWEDRGCHRGGGERARAKPMTDGAQAGAALRVIGQRLPRVDARERVTGEARYPADLALPGMAHARLLRSPHAHARILRIDTTRAAALRGVLAVVSAADFPELPVGATIPMGEVGYDMWMVAQINMARRKVHWVGQPVAAVAAVDVHVAEAALALIEVEYEPLPAVLDIAAAMAADAPVLHEHVFTKGIEPRPRTPGNVCSRTVIARGDAQGALTAAPATARLSVQVDTAHQGYLEPQAMLAQVDANGFATVWASTQGQFTAELMIAAHARPAGVQAQDRADRDRRRLRRQDRHPRRSRGGPAGAEVPATREARAVARGGAAGRLGSRRRGADRYRGGCRGGRAARRHRGHLSSRCRRIAGAQPVAGDAGLGRALPMPKPRSAGLRRRHQQAAHRGLSRARRHPGGLRHGAGDGHAVP